MQKRKKSSSKQKIFTLVIIGVLLLVSSVLFVRYYSIRKNKAKDELLALSFLKSDRRFAQLDTYYKPKTSKSKNIPQITWHDVVFVIFIYDSQISNDFVAAHYQTWMRRIGEGCNIVFVTDDTDTRSTEEILPYRNSVKAIPHVYKSPARDDGKHLRYKVIDGFRYAHKILSEKQYFLKMDTDTFFIPENLLNFLNQLEHQTFSYPVMFGSALCLHGLIEPVCYGTGSGYGFNQKAFDLVNKYLDQNLYVSEEIHPHPKQQTKNLMQHEDFMMGIVFRRASSQAPLIHVPILFPFGLDTYDGPGWQATKRNAISYHKLKPNEFHYIECLFYNDNGSQRTYDEIKLLKKTKLEKCQVFKRMSKTSGQI